MKDAVQTFKDLVVWQKAHQIIGQRRFLRVYSFEEVI